MNLQFWLFVIALPALALYLWQRRRLYRLAWQLPGPIGWPLVGVGYMFFDASKVVSSMCCYGRHGSPSKLWLGNRLFVYVDDPVSVEVIMNAPQCINKGASYWVIEKLMGKGLITIREDEWRLHRKLLNPMFATHIVKKFDPIYNWHARQLVERLDRWADGQTVFDIQKPLKEMSMDLISETTMDTVMSTESGENRHFMSSLHRFLEIAGIQMFNPLFRSNIVFEKSHYHTELLRCTGVCRRVVADMFQRKLSDHAAQTKNRISFIDRVLRLTLQDNAFSMQDAMDETMTVVLAGYETTASSLSHLILMLAMHPEHQERAYNECKAHLMFGDAADGAQPNDDDITGDSLAGLEFLDRCIKESMRLIPAVPFLTRQLTRDVEIAGLTIPPGIEFVVNVMAMHRSPKYFAKPNDFDPDHFLPEAVSARHPYTFIPFSAGARSCIGMRYAYIVMRICVIHLLRRYRFRTEMRMEDFTYRMDITIHTLCDHLVRMERR